MPTSFRAIYSPVPACCFLVSMFDNYFSCALTECTVLGSFRRWPVCSSLTSVLSAASWLGLIKQCKSQQVALVGRCTQRTLNHKLEETSDSPQLTFQDSLGEKAVCNDDHLFPFSKVRNEGQPKRQVLAALPVMWRPHLRPSGLFYAG